MVIKKDGNGNNNPNKPKRNRASKEDFEQRINLVMNLLQSGYHKYEIKELFRKHYNIKWRQTERYLRHARERLKELIGLSTEELRAQSYAWYMSQLKKRDVPIKIAVEIRKAADRLMGLPLPQRVELQRRDATSIDDLTDAQLLEIIQKAEKHDEPGDRDG